MLTNEELARMRRGGREMHLARPDEDADALGPLQLLPGTWANEPDLPGRGWNLIALPFANVPPGPENPLNYRLLMNQYNEVLTFSFVDKGIPNRGVELQPSAQDTDQLITALDYEQLILQVAADDRPDSPLRAPDDSGIHHEPGLMLHIMDRRTDDLDIARLATIPHGDSVLAMGRSGEVPGPPQIGRLSGLPIGVTADLDSPYLAPYRHFHVQPFRGLFDPTDANALLVEANAGVNIVRTTVLDFDSTLASGGIVNIPFVVRQANAAEMQSTFWIQEIDNDGERELRLQYSQTVLLDFFPQPGNPDQLIRWPHISINTMRKVAEPSGARALEHAHSLRGD